MKPKLRLTLGLATAAIAVGGGIAQSALDCASVIQKLKGGASPQEVAETMAISEADVKDCQDSDEVESAGTSSGGAALETGDSNQSQEPFWKDDSGKSD